ncbi:hypothetical protein SASPL_126117 [Salvia splendens]|uniref:Uncharacterized protein n=1 Tax=Salvia splendens TaxID=180675 RepID=A0A8X8XH33_SALSN|nr:uncharacterized protein LOC121749202 [Salvia splendens]KAG6413408.1 hypothetical protein SASPL_126117 [Salvia splendens]
MEAFNFEDVRVEKANAVAKYRRIQRITSLFRFVELFVFLIVVTRFSAQFAVFLKLSGEYLRGISVVALISPGSVFVIGNAIVIALFLISRRLSGERSTDFYDEYVEKCRSNSNQIQPPILSKSVEKCRSNNSNQIQQQIWSKSVEKSARTERGAISRTRSANLERVRGEEERRRDLRRSLSEKCRKRAEEEMSSEEFRQTVEAFIARQQRLLREEEGDASSMVSFQA